ncbi:Hsp70 family protein [Cryptosporangium sp. NPDC048952]|uniref:Hsp70 family protein n=1 Tax=Cryptosporangium sp. NPDC048952 TaxID=3363961 RepID=UPI00371BBE24
MPLLFDGSPSLPSAVVADLDGTLLTGRDALRSAGGAPDCFEPHPKRCIDDGTLLLGNLEYPIVEVIAATLSRVAAEAHQVLGRPPSRTRLTHPVAWGPQRTRLLADAAARAGLSGVSLVAEPVAAAHSVATSFEEGHPAAAAARSPGSWLIYDLGAGTTDITLVHDVAVVASRGLPDLGGLDVDQAIFEHFGSVLAGRDPQMWQRLVAPTTVADRRAAIGFRLDLRAAKELLSRRSSTLVRVPWFDIDLPLGRETVEEIAQPVVIQTFAAVRDVLRGAPEATGLFLVGGACRMPLVATLLHREFGIAPVLVDSPELVVASGALLVPEGPTRDPGRIGHAAGETGNLAPVTAVVTESTKEAGARLTQPDPPVRRARQRGRRPARLLGGVLAAVCFVTVLVGVRLVAGDSGTQRPPAEPRLSGAAELRKVGQFTVPAGVSAAYAAPDLSYLIVTDETGRAWSAKRTIGQWQELRSVDSREPVRAVVFDARREGTVTFVRADGAVETWSAEAGLRRGTAESVGATVGLTAVDGEYLAVATPAGAVRSWGPYYTEAGATWTKLAGEVTALAFGHAIVAATSDGVLHYRQRSSDGVATVHAGPSPAVAVTSSGSGIGQMAAADTVGGVRCWAVDRLSKASREMTLKALPLVVHGKPVTAVTFSDDGRYLATASADGTARVWLVETGRPIATVSGLNGLHGFLQFHQKRLQVTTIDETTGLRVWQIAVR